MRTMTWKIDGMHCGGCAQRLQALLARLPGVRRVEVSWPEGRARLLLDPREVSPERLVELIERAGYRVAAEQPRGDPP
ncbi:heavy-metal-associated domain-containing protein [Pelomicrobium sp.]|jgi:copper chaperone CopZ|uniref:heavy-metal-associated domain-containing protein n=1 Tax=Pelomicrobium sp. TaxID=2815319 RepID=UPI002FDCA795